MYPFQLQQPGPGRLIYFVPRGRLPKVGFWVWYPFGRHVNFPQQPGNVYGQCNASAVKNQLPLSLENFDLGPQASFDTPELAAWDLQQFYSAPVDALALELGNRAHQNLNSEFHFGDNLVNTDLEGPTSSTTVFNNTLQNLEGQDKSVETDSTFSHSHSCPVVCKLPHIKAENSLKRKISALTDNEITLFTHFNSESDNCTSGNTLVSSAETQLGESGNRRKPDPNHNPIEGNSDLGQTYCVNPRYINNESELKYLYACPHCDMKTTLQRNIIAHIISVHFDQPEVPFDHDECPGVFPAYITSRTKGKEKQRFVCPLHGTPLLLDKIKLLWEHIMEKHAKKLILRIERLLEVREDLIPGRARLLRALLEDLRANKTWSSIKVREEKERWEGAVKMKLRK